MTYQENVSSFRFPRKVYSYLMICTDFYVEKKYLKSFHFTIHIDSVCHEKLHQFTRQGRNDFDFDFTAPTHLYFFVALNMTILEL